MKSIKILALFVAFFIVQPIFAQEQLYRISSVSGKKIPVSNCQKGEYVLDNLCLKKIPNTEKGNIVRIFTYDGQLFTQPSEKSKKLENVDFGEYMVVINEKNGWYFLDGVNDNKKGWIRKSNVLSVGREKGLLQSFPDINGNNEYFFVFGKKCFFMYEEQNPYTITNGNECIPTLLNKKLPIKDGYLYGYTSTQGAYVYTFPNMETAEIKDTLDGEELIFVEMAIESHGWYWVSWIDDDDDERHYGWVTENDISFEN